MDQKGNSSKQTPKEQKLIDYKDLERNIINEISTEFHKKNDKKKN